MEERVVHQIGCVCESCSASYERDRVDPRDRPWSSNAALAERHHPSQRRND